MDSTKYTVIIWVNFFTQHVFKFHFQKEIISVYGCNPSNLSLPRRTDLWISYNHRNWNSTSFLYSLRFLHIQQFCYLVRQNNRTLQQEKQARVNSNWNWILQITKQLSTSIILCHIIAIYFFKTKAFSIF